MADSPLAPESPPVVITMGGNTLLVEHGHRRSRHGWRSSSKQPGAVWRSSTRQTRPSRPAGCLTATAPTDGFCPRRSQLTLSRPQRAHSWWHPTPSCRRANRVPDHRTCVLPESRSRRDRLPRTRWRGRSRLGEGDAVKWDEGGHALSPLVVTKTGQRVNETRRRARAHRTQSRLVPHRGG